MSDKKIKVRLYERLEPQAFARGGLAQVAEKVRRGGRGDDEILLHLTQEEFNHLKKSWGEPDINPNTGLPEYGWLSKQWKSVKKRFKKIAPILSFILPLIPGVGTVLGVLGKTLLGKLGATAATAAKYGSTVGKALSSGALGSVNGGLKGGITAALSGGLGGGAGSMVGQGIGGALSKVAPALGAAVGKGPLSSIVGNSLISGGLSKLSGGDFKKGAVAGAVGTAALPILNNLAAGTVLGPKLGLTSKTTVLDQLGKSDWLGSQGRANAQMPAVATPELNPTPSPGPEQGGWDGMGPPKELMMENPQPAQAQQSAGLMDLVKKYGTTAAMLGMMGGGGEEEAPPELPSEFTSHLPILEFERKRQRIDPMSYYTYGQGPEQSFYEENDLPTYTPGAARGGSMSRFVNHGTGANGRKDNIDAKLSEMEYVFDAETVALLGDGNPEAGARALDQMREQIRKHKGKSLARGKISGNAKPALAYLGGK